MYGSDPTSQEEIISMSLVQYVAGSASILFLFVVLYSVYKKKIQEAYALIWIFTGLIMIVFSLSPYLLHCFSRLVGIKTPAFALLSFLLMGILFLLFQVTVVISRQNEKINQLMQEVAILNEMKKK